MRIQVVSDLHLEFGTTTILTQGNTDTLILSGDICIASDYDQFHIPELLTRAKSYTTFFEQVCKEFKNVIYVFGNHEHYHGNFANTHGTLCKELKHFGNLHVLNNDHVVIDGVVFVGGTLWTDFCRNDPVVKWDAQRMMNDYRKVFNGPKNRFKPDDAYNEHHAMIQYIDSVYKREDWLEMPNPPIVVCGHHAPSFESISGRYAGNSLNGAYASDLVDFITERPRIKLWTHGHVHTTFDYMIGSTRVVCNPRGYYGYEENDEFDYGKVIEV